MKSKIQNLGHLMKKREIRFAYAVVIPLFLIYALFNLYPIVKLVELSMQHWPSYLEGKESFICFDNYRRLFSDPIFRKSLSNTFYFAFLRVSLGMIIGLIVALAINMTKGVKRAFFVFSWFSPYITSIIAMALVFTYFYNPSYGLFDYLLKTVGLKPMRFLASTKQALPSIVFVDLWKNIGFTIIIFLSGLQCIPQDYYDAASVDGAGLFYRFRHITFPLLMPTTMLLLLMNIITSMRVFTTVYMMTSISGAVAGTGLGGPNNSTNVLTLFTYMNAFKYNDFSYASASSIILFLIIMVLTLVQQRITKTRWTF